MKCQKCESENEWGNFCGNCANPLREKCPECGKMEWINRKVCWTQFNDACDKRERYVEKKLGIKRMFNISSSPGAGELAIIICNIPIFLLLPIIMKTFLPSPLIFLFILTTFVPMVVEIFIAYKIVGGEKQKIEEQFSKEFPDLDEIIVNQRGK